MPVEITVLRWNEKKTDTELVPLTVSLTETSSGLSTIALAIPVKVSFKSVIVNHRADQSTMLDFFSRAVTVSVG